MALMSELQRLLVGPPHATAADTALRDLLLGRPQTQGSWDDIAAAARYQEVVPMAAASHPELEGRLHLGRRRQALVDLHLHIALQRVGKALDRASIHRAALLKGSGTAYWLYDEPSDRVRRDIDLLVGDNEIEATVAALEADGWYAGASETDRKRGPRNLRAWPMYLELPIGIVSCDLHRRLTYGSRFTVDVEALLDRARHDLADTPLPVTAPADTFVHTALHCALSGFQEPLKAWIDLLRLARHRELSWPEVASTARRWGAANAVWAAAHVLERWFELDLGELRASVRPDPLTRRLLTTVLAGNGRYPLRADVDRRTAVATTALAVCDTTRSRADYLYALVARRVAPRLAPA